MKFLQKIILLLTVLIPSLAQAQFYVTGDDPGKLKWSFIDTDNFRVIYPSGCDSLARKYAFELEKFKIPVSRTTGYIAGQGDGKLMPAVMHTYNANNGSVAWAPKRMDLFTIPSAYDPDPVPWSTMLAVHEGRHVTQMQFGMTNFQKPFTYAFGQMWNILVSLLYPGLYLIEGDAVIAETALTPSGRGRTADFLNYYRVAFDQGDFRTWDRWLFGSQKYYAPDHYSLGYMTFGGIRYLYDYPTFMKDGYEMASRKLLNFSPFMYKIRKNRTGVKFKETFKEVCDTMQSIWSRDAMARAPFIYMEEVTKEPRLYTNYSNTVINGSDIYTIKKGYLDTPSLIKIDNEGQEKLITRLPYETSDLQIHNGRLYWSEDKPDERWSMKSDSWIRSIGLNGKNKEKVSDKSILLYNPSFSNDRMAATRYFPDGGSAIYIDGQTIMAPDGLQIVETAWIGDTIYATAVSDNGFGIYSYNGTWNVVLEPEPVKICDFKSYADELTFICDRTSVNELYHLDPDSGDLRQKTVTKYGAKDYAYSSDGRYLYFSSPTLNGMKMFRTPVDSLIDRKADYKERYRYMIADGLAEQEKEIALSSGYDEAVDDDIKVNMSAPKKYGKASHAFNIHSWTPVYVNVDNIMSMSFDRIYQAASLGASAIMQNSLSTGVGEFGYSAHKDPYDNSKWRHSGHFKYTYSGFYPVIETQFDFNDRAARQYNVTILKKGDKASTGLDSKELNSPYFQGRISAYIPFNFTSGGWYKGLIPRISYTITNDMFNTSAAILDGNLIGKYPGNPPLIGVTEGKNTFRHYLTGSLRAYSMLTTPNSAAYPRWGIGTEIGFSANLECPGIMSPMGYAYLYGYVPGFTREQGLKLSVMHQQKLDMESIFSLPTVNFLPRGLASTSSLSTQISLYNPSITKVSADYAIPIYIGDISIAGGLVYIKRLCLTPHADYMRAGTTDLVSVGSALTFDLNGLIWIGWPVSVGATYSYSGLADYDLVKSQTGLDMNPHYVGAIFNVSF